jgi:hypothetical protein
LAAATADRCFVAPGDYAARQFPPRSRHDQVSDAQKLKALEDENRRLKKLLAESMLDVAALKDLLGKN